MMVREEDGGMEEGPGHWCEIEDNRGGSGEPPLTVGGGRLSNNHTQRRFPSTVMHSPPLGPQILIPPQSRMLVGALFVCAILLAGVGGLELEEGAAFYSYWGPYSRQVGTRAEETGVYKPWGGSQKSWGTLWGSTRHGLELESKGQRNTNQHLGEHSFINLNTIHRIKIRDHAYCLYSFWS